MSNYKFEFIPGIPPEIEPLLDEIRVRAEYVPQDDRTFRELKRMARDACEQ